LKLQWGMECRMLHEKPQKKKNRDFVVLTLILTCISFKEIKL